ncbi:MAG: hypothetical protein IKB40_03385 [Paludibacteraceae bacterium]|nr:hypothetical protein [Paludibacteraceae bacterium]
MKKWLPILCMMMGMVACQQNIVSDDPLLQLDFSHDTVLFDTVFTSMGSSTKRVMVYNPNKHAICINQVSMREGKHFQINLDGENNLDQLRDITLRGGDSLFLFVRAYIDPLAENSPVLIEDNIAFGVNGKTQQITLQAYGQNVEKIQGDRGLMVYQHLKLTNQKPYLIYDTVAVAGNLTIEAGATIYMHAGASMYVYGSMTANGTQDNPIIVRGDRTDKLFDSVPYRMASGQWDGIYLLHAKGMMPPMYQLNYVDILSGSVGLYVYSESTGLILPKLTMKNSRIHNHSIYGLVVQNVDAEVVNCEISNCASYCVYLAGGKHQFVHNTIAAYYGYPYTNLNIHQNIIPEDVAAVYINNLSKNNAKTISSFTNCIITGGRKQSLMVATPLPDYYEGRFEGNYLRCDSLDEVFAKNNVYASDSDTMVFRNTYYLYEKYHYYDFHLDSLSPARGIGDSIVALSYPTDREGYRRKAKPDAGCYEFVESL